jgi:hypothetical protein
MRSLDRFTVIRPLLGGVMLAAASAALASSHREAPFITEVPKVDGTDFYMFRSYEAGRQDFVTIVANYVPLQAPYGGPNYFSMDPDARYEINIDNNGDAKPDLIFSFQFTNTLQPIALTIGGQSVAIPLVNAGVISTLGNDPNLNVRESFTCSLTRFEGKKPTTSAITNAATGASTFAKPVDNIGSKSIPDYDAYAAQHIYSIAIPGCATPGRLFVGQRDDPFVVNLGEIFDLVNTNPLGPPDAEEDLLFDANCTSFILELPISCLVSGDPVIGGWTTASLPAVESRLTNGTFDRPTLSKGRQVQVSRLGMPLVNELVIGLPDKNKFNGSQPVNDGQFLTYVTNPTFPALLQILFPGVAVAPCLPRNDLVTAFLTGVPGLNQPAGVVPSEMLRLNTSLAPKPAAMQNPLGVLGGDTAGYPNGRRPGDDVVDITLRVAMGALLTDAVCAPNRAAPLTDGAFINASQFDSAFPYIRTPLAGSPN